MDDFVKTHKGFFFGFVPVYLDMRTPEAPGVEVRHPWLEWMMDFGEVVFSLCVSMRQCFDPLYEPEFPILITGEIK